MKLICILDERVRSAGARLNHELALLPGEEGGNQA